MKARVTIVLFIVYCSLFVFELQNPVGLVPLGDEMIVAMLC